MQDSKKPEAQEASTAEPQKKTETGRWSRAIAVRAGHGTRSAGTAQLQVVCDAGMYSLDAALQKGDKPGWFVLGQVFLRDNKPADKLDVVLHVDEEPVESSQTDEFGEFAFTSRPGKRVGVALKGSETALVELWRQD
jgi:hypothetical protein